jgi:hypothetical protein
MVAAIAVAPRSFVIVMSARTPFQHYQARFRSPFSGIHPSLVFALELEYRSVLPFTSGNLAKPPCYSTFRPPFPLAKASMTDFPSHQGAHPWRPILSTPTSDLSATQRKPWSIRTKHLFPWCMPDFRIFTVFPLNTPPCHRRPCSPAQTYNDASVRCFANL